MYKENSLAQNRPDPGPMLAPGPSAARLAALLGALLCLPLAAAADAADSLENEPARLHLRGFGTLGLTRSSADGADFVRDLSQPRGTSGGNWSSRVDSVLGLQANWQATDQLEAVVQGVTRYRYDQTYQPELTWAYLKYDPTPSLSLRAGRLGTNFFMLADSRLVGYSYLAVRPSVDYFTSLPFSHVDGVDGSFTFPLGPGLGKVQAFSGRMHGSLALGDQQWQMGGSSMYGGHLDYLQGPWTLRAGYAHLRFGQNLPIDPVVNGLRASGVPSAAAAADALGTQDKDSEFYSLGALYESGPLQAQLMLNRIRQQSAAFQDSRAGTLLAGYRIGQFTPYAGYSWQKSTPKSLTTGLPPGLLNAAVSSILADSRSHQHTVTLGLRWDFRTNMDLKLQYDAVRGSSDSIFPTRRDTPGWNGRTDVISIVTDFIF